MNRREIVRYFKTFSRLYGKPCRIILTGAAAGSLYGRVRATMDLDFAVVLEGGGRQRKEARWREFEQAARRATQLTGIAVQYAEDIDRWSAITYLDYLKHTRPFRKFGGLLVRILDPAYWAIGKFVRYLAPDIRDLVEVLTRTKTHAVTLTRVLGRALKKSPKSTACELFRRQVEDFLLRWGRDVWGNNFSPDRAVRLFRRHAAFQD